MNRLLSKKYSIKNIVLRYILLLLPFILFGIYKNGYLIFQKGIINIWGIFKIIYLILISFGINFLFKLILKRKLNWHLDIISTIVITMFMPCNISYIYYIIGYVIGSIIFEFINKFININKMSIVIVTIYLFLLLTQGLNFLNPLEASNIYSFDTIDLFFGRTYGGIASTLIVYGYIFAILSSIFNNYKFVIPLTSIIVYFLLSYFVGGFSYKTYTNSFAIMSFILLTIDSKSNPIEVFHGVIYGLLWGILVSLVVIYLKNPIWIFICQIIVNILFQIIAKISKKCYNMNDFLSKNARGAYGLYK